MPLPAGFLDELRVRTPLATLVGRRARLARSGRNWRGCCPFHEEKSASFYVYDDHFHCYGCGAHGDAVSFVMQSQGAGFMEAVEQLAAEAGLEVPKPTPEAEAAERRRLDVLGVLEQAAAGFQRRLLLPEGRRALAYLRERGLSEATIRGFGLGWSGEGRGALAAEFAHHGIGAERLVEAGLMTEGANGPRELFFERVIFPIRDRRGRVISFGGRTLGDGQPKYLNGPETAVFAKRRSLYAIDRAREAARRGATVVLVEGYMDVIALHQAGFDAAVAPLGTAVTEGQLEGLWRLSPAPVICFDGDAAGRRASLRAADLALPLLGPERTLQVALLPEGEDPDTLVRGRGAARFQQCLAEARPLAEVLFDLLHEATPGSAPEQRAAFRARLEAAAARIGDRRLASEYRSALLERFFAARRGRPTPAGPKPSRTPMHVAAERARILTAILLRHPHLLRDVEEAYCDLDLPPALDRLRAAMHAAAEADHALDSAGLMNHLTEAGLAAEAVQALSAVPVPLPACASPEAMPAEAEEGWWHIFGFLRLDRLEQEVASAEDECRRQLDERTQARLLVLVSALSRVRSGEPDSVGQAA
ncbi:MAG: DNA primase [Acidisphaera sp.]|nr:DNA primase [Acidisphaera sp.]